MKPAKYSVWGILTLVLLLQPSRLAAQAEGIKVHGDWVIEVRNADGTLDQRHEFKNSLQAGGKQDLARLLARDLTVLTWRVYTESNATGMCISGANFCEIGEPGDILERVPSKNLTVTRDGANLVLAGSFVPLVGGTIGSVTTQLIRTGVTNPDAFSATSLATPVQVQASQTVAITVTFSFQ